MRKDDINDFIRKQEKISKRNFMNYQESGVSRYYRAHDRAEMPIDLARQALSAADDHEMVGIFRSELADFGNRAMSALHENNPENAFQCGKRPANEHVSDDRLPCGQWQCWVVLHTETWRKRGKG